MPDATANPPATDMGVTVSSAPSDIPRPLCVDLDGTLVAMRRSVFAEYDPSCQMAFLKHAICAARRRFTQRHRYANTGSWVVSLYDTFMRYGKRIPMPGRGNAVEVRLKGLPRPVYLRLGSSDGFVMEEIFFTGVYDRMDFKNLQHARTIVDLGANAGYSLRLWRQRCPHARIVAVEPDANNLAVCRQNIAESGGDVTLVPVAVAARQDRVLLDRSAEECAIRISGVTDAGDDDNAVECRTMTQILADTDIDGEIDLLKCDIEGSESEVFADCRPWIHRVRHLVIELHPPYDRQAFLKDVGVAGYRFIEQWFGQTAGNDLIYLRRVDSPPVQP